jgi:hypothetical protein
LQRFSDHDVQTDVLFLTFQIDLLDNLETKLSIDKRIDVIGALQIARSTFGVKLETSKSAPFTRNCRVISAYLLRDMLNQLPRISLSLGIRSRPDIDEVPRFGITISHDLFLGLVKQG